MYGADRSGMLTAMRVAVAGAVLVLLPRAAHAYRPFDQTDADAAEVNTIELELGPVSITSGDHRLLYGPNGVFNYGFSEGWELVFDYGATISLADLGSSFVLTDFMVKHVLREGSLQDKAGPSVAIEVGPLFPTVPTLEDEIGGSLTMIVSQRWDPIAVHVNATAAWTRDRAIQTTAGVIIEGPQTWRARPVGEFYVSNERGGQLYSGLVGAIYRFRAPLTFDVAVHVFHDDEDRNARSVQGAEAELRVGLTWVIPT
jgi:hypothetical protein